MITEIIGQKELVRYKYESKMPENMEMTAAFH